MTTYHLDWVPLTEQYANLTKGNTIELLGFLRNVWLSGKTVEALSFAYWEALYRLRVLRPIQFTNDTPITPHSNWASIPHDIPDRLSLRVSQSISCWKLLYTNRAGNGYACKYTSPCDLYRIPPDRDPEDIFQFPREILSLFVSSNGIVFVCLADGSVHRSSDSGKTFSLSLNLSTDESIFRFDYGMTEANNNRLIIGEYGNVAANSRWRSLAYLYCSDDGGESWDRSDHLLQHGVNKHVHLVRFCKFLDSLIVTDGDNKKQLWKVRMPNGHAVTRGWTWKLMNTRHVQGGGYASIVEADDRVLFGTDYQGGTNFIVHSKDCETFDKYVIPDPYRKCPVFAMTRRTSKRGNEVWATLYNSTDSTATSLLMFTRDNGNTWTKVIEYDGTKNKIHIVSAADSPTDTVYICVTSPSQKRNEAPLATFSINDA